MAYGMGGVVVVGGGSSLITDKRSHKYVVVLLGRKREKRDLKDGSLQLHRSAER